MDTLIKLNSTRVGRDKIFRTLQYALRAINSRPYLATDDSKDLEKTLASFRKLLRLGTFIDVLQSAKQSIHHPDFCTRILVTLARSFIKGVLTTKSLEDRKFQFVYMCSFLSNTHFTRKQNGSKWQFFK